MHPIGTTELFTAAAGSAAAFRGGLPDRRVAPVVDLDTLRAGFGGPLPAGGVPAGQVVRDLIAAAEPGLVATAGPRFFGFVIGGSLPSAAAADMLAAGWDQVAFNAATSPAAAVAEEVAGGWLKELLGLPGGASRRVRHRSPGGQHRRARRRPAPRAGRGRLGCRAGRPARRAPGPGGGRRGTARHHRPVAAAAGVRQRHRRTGRRRRQRRASTSTTCAGCWRPASRARPWCACRPGTSTPARATTSARPSDSCGSTAAGCTSTVRSGCGRRPARPPAGWSTGSNWPTPGRATGTSG